MQDKNMGVDSVVNKIRKIKSDISCTLISNIIITICISTSPKNITIIQTYAPTSTYEDDLTEILQTAQEYHQRNSQEIPPGWDWNTKAGPDAYEQWAIIVGCFEWEKLMKDETSGIRTQAQNDPGEISRRTTWHSPDGITPNQTDYILSPRWFKSSMNIAMSRIFPISTATTIWLLWQ